MHTYFDAEREDYFGGSFDLQLGTETAAQNCILIRIVGDSICEDVEDFTVNLGTSGPGTNIVVRNGSSVVFIDDEGKKRFLN